MTTYLDAEDEAAGDSGVALVNYHSSQNPESLRRMLAQLNGGDSGQHIYKRAVPDDGFCVSSNRCAELDKANAALANTLWLNSVSQKEIALLRELSPQIAASLVAYVREREERGLYDSWEDVMARNVRVGSAKVAALRNAPVCIALQKTRQPEQRNVCNAGVATANSQPRGLKRGSIQAEIDFFNQRTKYVAPVEHFGMLAIIGSFRFSELCVHRGVTSCNHASKLLLPSLANAILRPTL